MPMSNPRDQMLSRLPGMAYRCRPGDDRALLDVAGRALELTGHAPDVLVDTPGLFADLPVPEEREHVRRGIATGLAAGGAYELVYRIRTADGGIRLLHDHGEAVLDAGGAVVEVVGFLSDGTDRVTEQELRRAHRAVVSAALNPLQGGGDITGYARVVSRLAAETLMIRYAGIWLLSEDGMALTRLCAYDTEAGAFAGEVVLRAQDYPRYFAALISGRAIDAGDAVTDPRTSEFRDGYLLPGGISALLDAAIRIGGRIVGVVCCEHTGVPRRWRAHELSFAAELADQMAQALMARDKLQAMAALEREQESTRAKSDFITTMSHEIRTPMNGVLGITQLLKATPLDRGQREYLEMIEESGRMLLHIVNDILDYSKIEAGKFPLQPRPWVLRERLAALQRQFAPAAAGAGLGLVFTIDPAVPAAVVCDPERVQQILVNLLGNALKFTTRGEVRLQVAVEAGAAALLRLRVSDTGEGIPPELLPRLFEPFEQGRAADDGAQRRGTGLGLAISRRLAELMGGTLSCQSTPGQGATFTLTLPLQAATGEAPAPAPVAPRAADLPALADLRVLVAEDNEINRRVILGLLEKGHGIRADYCVNGQEAVERVQAQPYDLVFMDCEMPVLDGYEATRRIRALPGAAARTPIAALTAHAVAELRTRAEEAGMDYYLTKPVNREALAELLGMVAAAR